ncbi:MAG: HNH endonuclease signature motif containing protein [Dehalococcoidia bacterium]|nr:HNH endonuclease signature motif containing protein [Dehalococcoidia bacterium]
MGFDDIDLGTFDDERSAKRALGERDRKILYRNANKKCQNPGCRKKNSEIEYDEMQVGHKTAYSKGGKTTLKNSVCLCWTCNNLQGDYSWATFLKKQGFEVPKIPKTPEQSMKEALETLTVKQLKHLAEQHHIKVQGRLEEDFLDSHRVAPTKRQYINKLSGIVTNAELTSMPKETPKKAKAKKRRNSDSFW